MNVNNKNIINERKILYDIVNNTSVILQRKLTINEIRGLINYYRNININNIKNRNPIDVISKGFINRLQKRQNIESINIHELMKQHLGSIKGLDEKDIYASQDCPQYSIISKPNYKNVDNGSGDNNTYSTYVNNSTTEDDATTNYNSTNETNTVLDISSIYGKYLKTSSGIRNREQSIYLLLDSKYRNLSTDKSIFKWSVSNTNNATQGSVNTLVDNMSNIVMVQFDKFNIPYTKSAENIYKKVSLFIREFSSMSVLMNPDKRYHMLFESKIINDQIELSPINSDESKFRFHSPINILDSLTLSFKSPFEDINFKKDRYFVTLESIDEKTTYIHFTEEHEIVDGELIYIKYWKTNDPSKDKNVIDVINRDEGHTVTNIDNITLSINIDTTTTDINLNELCECFVASRRLIIPLRFIYIL